MGDHEEPKGRLVVLKGGAEPPDGSVLSELRSIVTKLGADDVVGFATVITYSDGTVGTSYQTGGEFFRLLGGVANLQARMAYETPRKVE